MGGREPCVPKEGTSPGEDGGNLLKKPWAGHPKRPGTLLSPPLLCFVHFSLQRERRKQEETLEVLPSLHCQSCWGDWNRNCMAGLSPDPCSASAMTHWWWWLALCVSSRVNSLREAISLAIWLPEQTQRQIVEVRALGFLDNQEADYLL